MNIYLTITFYDVSDEVAIEQLLCEQVSENTCRIKEIPLYAYNLALDDVVEFEKENDEYFFEALSSPSGYSTIQIVELAKNGLERVLDEMKDVIDQIRFDSPKYAAINVRSKQDYLVVEPILNEYEQQNKISFKEACLGFND